MTAAALDVLIKSTLLLATATLLLPLLRWRSASLQAGVLTSALAGVLLLPAAAPLLPAWQLRILTPPPVVSVDAPRELPAERLIESNVLPAASVNVRSDVAALTAPPPADPASRLAPTLAGVPWMLMAVAIWFAGTCGLLLHLLLSHLGLWRIVGRARRDVDDEWRAMVRAVGSELELGRAVDVGVSLEVGVPIVAGLVRPVLVLPEEARDWEPAVRQDVVRHELAHVARRDGLGQILGQLACAVHWPNPVVWLVANRAASLRERACDDAVLRAGTRASDYAARLLDLARAGSGLAPVSALAMARASRMRDRITSVLDPRARRDRMGRGAAAAVVTTMIVLVGGLGAMELSARAADVGAAAVIAAPMAAQSQAGMCEGNLRSSSHSNSENGRRRTWRVRLEGRDCDLDLRAEGTIEFNDEFTDVARIDQGGFLDIDMTTGGVRRELDIRSAAGGLSRTYRVDGRERVWDADGRQWFADLLIAIDRRTAIGIDHRFPRLLKQGVSAVLAETALMTGDYPRYAYQARLLDEARLSTADRRQILEQSAQQMRSDFYPSELLKKVVAQGRLEDAGERALVVQMIERLDSDFYRAEAISTLIGGGFSTDQLTALLRVVAGMDSDFYQAETLRKLLPAGTPSATDRALIVGVLEGIKSDFYVSETLKRLTDRNVLTPADVLSAASRVKSDYYRGDILASLLDAGPATEADLLKAVTTIDQMDSDHYKSEALRRVLANRGVTERVRDAVTRSADRLSSAYRRRVR